MQCGLIVILTPFLILSPVSAQPLTPDEAFSRFLQRSPLVAAEKEKLQMAQGRLLQTQAWANPILSYDQEGYPVGQKEASLDDQEFLIGAWQEFELGGQRGKRRDLAQLELEAENSRYRDFIRRKRLEINRLFARVFYASKRKGSLEEALRQYSRIRDTHRKRYELGEVSGLAQMKIEAEELWYLVELARSEREFNSSWSELASNICWEGATLPELSLEEPRQVMLPDSAVLINKALESRPDLKSQQLEALAAQIAVEAEKAKNIPNLNLGAGYKRDFGQNSFFVRVQLPLPLWDRRQGAIDEKLAANRRQGMLSHWKEIWIRHEVQRAYRVYSKLLAASRRLESVFVQKLESMVEITALSYQEGEAGILEYIDALRTQRDAVLAQNQLFEELHLAQLELEASVGIPLRDITP